eukprot:2853053-Rhodomonas_salina.1
MELDGSPERDLHLGGSGVQETLSPICYVCGEKFGCQSIQAHEDTCLEQWKVIIFVNVLFACVWVLTSRGLQELERMRRLEQQSSEEPEQDNNMDAVDPVHRA